METLPPDLVRYLQEQAAAAEAARTGKAAPARAAAPWTSAGSPPNPWTTAASAPTTPPPTPVQQWTGAGTQPPAEVWPRPQPAAGKPGLGELILKSLKEDFGGKKPADTRAGEAFKPQTPQAAPEARPLPSAKIPTNVEGQMGRLGKIGNKVGGPLGVASLGLAALPVANAVGDAIASKIDPLSEEYDRIAREKQAGKAPPAVKADTVQPVATAAAPTQAAAPTAQVAETQTIDPLMALRGQYTPMADATQEFAVPSAPAAAPADSGQSDKLLEAIAAILTNPSRQPVSYKPDASSTAAIEALPDVKPEVAQKKKGFVEGLKRFISAGNPNYNPNRLEMLDQEAANAKAQAANAVTPRTQAKAGIASADVQGAQAASRASARDVETTGGISPQDKFMLDLVGGSYEQQARTGAAKEVAAVEQRGAMDRLQAGAAMQKLTPESQRAAIFAKLVETYPDLFGAAGVSDLTGRTVSQEAMNSITNARGKNDPTALLMAELLREKLAERKAKAGPTLKTSSLTTK